MALRAEIEYEEDAPDEIKLCLFQLKDIELRDKLGALSSAIKAEKEEHKREELIKEFNSKAKELHQKS